jgi:PAS domain S-box-containing protein
LQNQSVDDSIAKSFRKDLEPLARNRVNIGLLIGGVFVPLFGLVDYLIYPEYFIRFMTYRLVISVFSFVLFAINQKWNLGFRANYLGIAEFHVVNLMIIKMILDTGGYGSPYYAGLNLVFLTFCIVLIIESKRLHIHCLILYIIYLVCMLLYSWPGNNVNLFLANNGFIITTLIIISISARVNDRLRWDEYLARIKLKEAQEQLRIYSKNLERNIAESEEKYRILVDNANESIFIVQDGFIKFPNPKTEEMLGYTGKELSETFFVDLIVPEDKEKVFEKYKSMEKGETVSAIPPVRIINKNGETLWVDINLAPIEWQGRAAILHLLRDITERKKMEDELIQIYKMEAIGTLAGGIAHEFNNLLQVISGYLELLLEQEYIKEPDRKRLSNIDKSAQRAAELTKQLLIYSRKVETKFQPVDINQEIVKVCELLGRVIPKMISIQTHLDDNLKRINADPGQLQQIIINLVVNARDAMPGGGKITIETKNFWMDDESCKKYIGAVPGEYVLLIISDTGQGIGQGILEQIFNPFFTTKEVGKGTGLGLAIVSGIVTAHGGYITCGSELGQGTTFEICFPVSSVYLKDKKAKTVSQGEIRGVGETILLVDDEKDILEAGQDILRKNNYKTLIARSGEEAIEVFKEEKRRIDLVILDLNMPGMGGFKCLGELHSIDPDVKVIVATGFLGNDRIRETLKTRASGFITKPYRFTEMLEKIKDTMKDNRQKQAKIRIINGKS